MAILGRDDSGYNARPPFPREDMDGTQHVWARAHGALTALTPYLCRLTSGGYTTIALFDTGAASATAASHYGYIPFVPLTAIASDTDGWGQVGGPCVGVICASQSASTGNYMRWSDATLTGTTAASATAMTVDCYGIVMATASSGAYDLYLRGVGYPIYGTT
jgi:hypothetical protein